MFGLVWAMSKVIQVCNFGVICTIIMVTSQVETRYQNDTKWPTFDSVLGLLTDVMIPLPNLYQASYHVECWYMWAWANLIAHINVVNLCSQGSCLTSQRPSYVLGKVTPSYINVYMCAHDLFIRGAIYFVKKIIRYGISQNKGKFLYFNTPYQ